MFNKNIATAFRFTEDDLEQNKKGIISDRQKAITRRGGKMACFALIILGLLIALGVYHVNKDKNDTAFLRATIVFSAFAVIGLYFLFRAFYIAARSVIKKASGAVSIIYKRKIGNCVVINNISFPVSGTHITNLFQADRTYTAYYIGNATLLSFDEL